MSRPDRLSIKFLVSNGLAGTLIGTGGNAIKELIEISGARVSVSSLTDVYPGTSDRIVLISGVLDTVDSAQSLVWEMMAANIQANGDKTVSWSPRTAQENQGQFDDIPVSGKVSIPASAGGMILGRGGASLRQISEESGARVQMSGKDDSIFTQERILTISGSPDACAKCVSAVVTKLAEDLVAAQYVNHGVTYSSHINAMAPGGYFQQGQDRRYRGRRGSEGEAAAQAPPADVSANSSITVSVPDSAVGNILGRGVRYILLQICHS